MTSFTRTEIQKAKPWRIIAQKNKGALHISWLPDRISTVSVPWLSFHSSPKTSLSSGGGRRGREWERNEHRRAPSSASRPAACGEQGSARAPSRLPPQPPSPTRPRCPLPDPRAGGTAVPEPSPARHGPHPTLPRRQLPAAPGLARVRRRGGIESVGEATCQRRGLIHQSWGGKQLGKSLGGFFPSSENSLKPCAARPRTQVSFEREQAALAPGKPWHGQHRGAPVRQGRASGLRAGAAGERVARKGDLLQDFEVEGHLLPKPQPRKRTFINGQDGGFSALVEEMV